MRASQKVLIAISVSAFLLIALGIIWWTYKGSLEIEAKIIYNMGGPQPVARQTFYLLDIDPFSLRADDPQFTAKMDAAKTEDEKKLLTLQSANFLLLKLAVEKKQMKEGSEKAFLGILEISKPFWEDHLIQSVQTDFNGQAKFNNLKPGRYWLIGMTETRAAFAFWNVSVSVGWGENKLLLDQNNSMYSK
jgi:hypothetical protein